VAACFNTATLLRGSEDERSLRALNEKVLTSLGYQYGASHVEYIKGKADGRFYLLETSARVGGARIAEMHEFATGINLWEEWANIECDLGLRPYKLKERRADYSGLLMTLARQAKPDFSAYTTRRSASTRRRRTTPG